MPEIATRAEKEHSPIKEGEATITKQAEPVATPTATTVVNTAATMTGASTSTAQLTSKPPESEDYVEQAEKAVLKFKHPANNVFSALADFLLQLLATYDVVAA